MPPYLENPIAQWFLATAVLAALSYMFIRRELRVRATAYGSVLAACIVAFWPPHPREVDGKTIPGKVRLGLDLQGGIHMVMRVVSDEAVVAIVDDAVETSRVLAVQKGVTIGGATRLSNTSFAVENIEPARVKDLKDALRVSFPTGWKTPVEEGTRLVLELEDAEVRRIREQTVDETVRTLERRVNQLGVAEPIIAKHGENNDQVLIQLPGVKNISEAREILQKTAQLTLKLVEDAASTRETLLEARGGQVPAGFEVVPGKGEEPGKPMFYLVRREAVITGRDLKNARTGVDQNNQPNVEFTLKPAGGEKFGRATGQNVGKRLAVILDGFVESAPTIQSKIVDNGEITGIGDREESEILAKVLRAGALPASLKPVQEITVGASLGKDSIESGVRAVVVAMALLFIFLIVYYRLSGVNAIVALLANLVILLGAMAYAGATLTLPGIAGIILTVGVGVDTNVLVFERIREEIRNGKPVRNAVNNGFERVWITILDTHATALIAAAFLFQFGTGPVKGFAVTLVWGLLANVFASYFVSKFLFEWVLGKRQVATLSI